MARSRRNDDKPITEKTGRRLVRELKRTRRVEREADRRERMHPAARTEPYDFRQDVTSTQPIRAVDSGTHDFRGAIDEANASADALGAPRASRRFPLDGPGPYGVPPDIAQPNDGEGV